MYVKLADGSQYELIQVRNMSRFDIDEKSGFVFRFNSEGRNVTTLINELKEKLSVESNLKNLQVVADSLENVVTLHVSKVDDMLMVMNTTSAAIDVTFAR